MTDKRVAGQKARAKKDKVEAVHINDLANSNDPDAQANAASWDKVTRKKRRRLPVTKHANGDLSFLAPAPNLADVKATTTPAATAPADTPAPPVKRRRRRRRQSKANVLAARTIADIKRKERQFLREVSAILTDALGFPVRVSHVKVPQTVAPTPRMGRFARMPRREAHRQIMQSFAPLNDPLPIKEQAANRAAFSGSSRVGRLFGLGLPTPYDDSTRLP